MIAQGVADILNNHVMPIPIRVIDWWQKQISTRLPIGKQ
jgi:hypothetical protein